MFQSSRLKKMSDILIISIILFLCIGLSVTAFILACQKKPGERGPQGEPGQTSIMNINGFHGNIYVVQPTFAIIVGKRKK